MIRESSAHRPLGSVVVIGGMNLDIVGKSLAPFRPADSNPGLVSTCPGGVGRNIAENLARLDFAVELITVLGKDDRASELEASCAEKGIGLTHAIRSRRAPTSVYLCLLGEDGRLTGAVAAMEAMEELLPPALEERSAALDAASCIVVDANIPESSLAWIAERYKARPRGGRPLLVLDPVSVAKARKAKAHIGAFDLAKPNIAEARILAGGTDEDDPAILAAALRERGLGAVHISLGPDGMYYEGFRHEGEKGLLVAPSSLPERLEARNVSGAGDAACAALVWAAFKGFGARERSKAALAAAYLAASVEETVHPQLSPEILSTTMKELFPPRSPS